MDNGEEKTTGQGDSLREQFCMCWQEGRQQIQLLELAFSKSMMKKGKEKEEMVKQ
jgi:hypothetical protein